MKVDWEEGGLFRERERERVLGIPVGQPDVVWVHGDIVALTIFGV